MRALRFRLRLPARYRTLDESSWRQTFTIDISSSGVLFEGRTVPAVGARIEFLVRLGREAHPGERRRPSGEVSGVARVVRILTPAMRGVSAFAVVLETYDVRPAQAVASDAGGVS